MKCVNGKYEHKDALNPPDDCTSKSGEYFIIEVTDEGQIKIRVKKINNSRKSVIEDSNCMPKDKNKVPQGIHRHNEQDLSSVSNKNTTNYEVTEEKITFSINLMSNRHEDPRLEMISTGVQKT